MQDTALPLHFNRIDPARNIHRFYALSIEADLFGHVLLVRRWGRIGTQGQRLVEVHETRDCAARRLSHVARVKQGRGYVPLSGGHG